MINLELKGTTKDEIIDELSIILLQAGCIKDIEEYKKDVYLRESEGITGMGSHVAIPHGKSSSVLSPAIAIGRSKKMIEWESYDDQPVNIFFLFAVPKDNKGSQVHLKLLSQLASKLADENLLEEIQSAKTAKELSQLLIRGEE